MIDATVLVLTFNESPNLARTLGRVSWARSIVVVDSGSTDDTRALAAQVPNVRIFERAFTTHAEQWNFGLHDTGISTEWVLALDADFLLSDGLIREIESLDPPPDVAGYRATFTYCIHGQPLRSGVYPPVVVLYRRTRARYEADGHTQRVRVDGVIKPFAARIFHDDRKSLTHWLWAQSRYMRLEADKLAAAPDGSLDWLDRMRRWIVLAPPATFVYCYLVRGGIRDGRAGLYYALQRAASELLLSLFLVDRLLSRGSD